VIGKVTGIFYNSIGLEIWRLKEKKREAWQKTWEKSPFVAWL